MRFFIFLFFISIVSCCKIPCKNNTICMQSCEAINRIVPDFLKDELCPTIPKCNTFAIPHCINACSWFKLGPECEKGCKLFKFKNKNGKI